LKARLSELSNDEMSSDLRTRDWSWEPAEHATLVSDELHVWRVSVLQPEPVVRHWQSLLTPSEKAKLARFRFPADAQRGLASRGALRSVLGKYLEQDGATLEFTTEQQGKPVLAGAFPMGRIEFNVSHSGDWVLLGFARGRPLGVDVEQWRELETLAPIVRDYFAPPEVDAWLALPDALRQEGFFNGWTRKEAYLKALGLGLFKPLDRFHVRLTPGQPPALLFDADDPHAPSQWQMHAVDMGQGYSGAVAVFRGASGVRWLEFQG
jgi:4'-phosphopantetheinyl transferase